MNFALKIEKISKKKCPIVGSFSVIHENSKNTYLKLADYIKQKTLNEGGILPQFLPKRAWYFGGAVDLNLFCHINDKKYFTCFTNGICLDTAHLVMACNSANGKQSIWFKELLSIASHIHISDARGEDGEGVKFGKGELKFGFLKNVSKDIRIIVEQWEGHLENFKGFKNALIFLESLKCTP